MSELLLKLQSARFAKGLPLNAFQSNAGVGDRAALSGGKGKNGIEIDFDNLGEPLAEQR